MSLDRSLKTKGKLSTKRSVLTRTERLAILKESRQATPESRKALGLPKTLIPRG